MDSKELPTEANYVPSKSKELALGLAAQVAMNRKDDSLQLSPAVEKTVHLNGGVSSGAQNPFCHGRVAAEDFEKMVPAQWWKSVFADAMYLKTDGDVVEDPLITEEEIRMLESNPRVSELFQRGMGQKCDANSMTMATPQILDLCCGQGRHSLYLASKYPGLKLYGHDQSSFLISVARDRASSIQDKVSSPIFTVGDCRSVPHSESLFDLVMVMGNSFGYFSANDHAQDGSVDPFEADGDRQVLKEINRLLKQGGRMVLDLADGDYLRENFSPRSWEWIDDNTFVCRERTLSEDKKRLNSREVIVATNRGVVRDQFYSERLYGKEELVDLLQEAGFEVESDESFNEEGLNTVTAAKDLSQRGQDLGMMEQRLLIFAKKVRLHPRLVNPEAMKLKEETHPYLSSENARAVREWLERLSPDMFAKNANNLNDSRITSEDVDHLRSYIVRLKESMKQNEKLSLKDTAEAISSLNPAVYHLLPPPPFPKDQVAVLLGDTSLPCRDKLNGQWNKEDFETRKKLISALVGSGFIPQQISILENHKDLVQLITNKPSFFALNFCDEGLFNDANKELHVSALLESCDIPYSGAGPVSLAVCYDKGLVNSTAAKLGIPTPKECYIIIPSSMSFDDIKYDYLERIVLEKEECNEIQYPAFVKPMKGDNSLGITSKSVVHDRAQLVVYIEELISTYSLKEFVVQEYLTGTEYSVGMIGNPETGFHFFPVLQVDYSKIVREGFEPILGWESKWDPDSPYWTDINYTPAKTIPSVLPHDKKVDLSSYKGCLTEEEEANLKMWCVTLFERFGCRDYARFDWRADKNSPFETNEESSRLPAVPHVDIIRPDDKEETNACDDHCSSRSEVSGTTELKSASSSNSSNESGAMDSGRGSSYLNEEALTFKPENSLSNPRTLKLLEVNPNPGWCWDGKMAKMAHFEGKSYDDLIKSIAWASWERLYGKALRETTKM